MGCLCWSQYLMSLYWVAATLSANGTVGNIFPQNLVEVWYTVLLLILNLTVVRAILGEVTLQCPRDSFRTLSTPSVEAFETFNTVCTLWSIEGFQHCLHSVVIDQNLKRCKGDDASDEALTARIQSQTRRP
eukprot:589379-Rhodomonas_salina.2